MILDVDTVTNGTSLTNRPRATVGGSDWPVILKPHWGASLAGSSPVATATPSLWPWHQAP